MIAITTSSSIRVNPAFVFLRIMLLVQSSRGMWLSTKSKPSSEENHLKECPGRATNVGCDILGPVWVRSGRLDHEPLTGSRRCDFSVV